MTRFAAARRKTYSPVLQPEAAETPFSRARHERADQIAAAIAQARGWRITAWLFGAVLAGSLAGNIYLGAQPSVVPHIIEVDQLGTIQHHGPVRAAATQPSEALVGAQLRRFLEQVRTITGDSLIMKRNWIEVYQMLTPQARARMNEWAGVNNPVERARKESVAIEIVSAGPVSDKTWQIDWRERRWDRSGTQLGNPVVWRAMLTTTLKQAESAAELSQNPLGIYVDEFHWDRVTARSEL